MLKQAIAVSLVGLFAASSHAAEPAVTHMGAPKSATGISAPFSEGVMAGETFYVAGHLGLDPATGQTPANLDTEIRTLMDAVKHTLERAGLTPDDLVSVTVYCTDLDLFDKFNAAYRGYFHGQFPARAFIGVDKLLRGAHFEVAGIAVRPPGARKL